MGNVVRTRKFVLFIPYLIVLTVAVGCNVPPPPALQQSTEGDKYINVESACNPLYECQFIVTIGPFMEDMVYDVSLHADYGVDFEIDDAFQNKVSDLKDTSTVTGIHMQPYGTRVVRFPFTFDADLILAGRYVVDIELVSQNPPNDPDLAFIDRETAAFVYVDEYGRLQLMRSVSEFDAEYTHYFTDGTGAAYAIHLDPGERPIHGKVYVKLTAPHDEYDPVLTMHTDGGIAFKHVDPIVIVASRKGCRILVFPFQIIEDAYQPDGRYVFSVSIEEDELSPVHEILPLAVELVSEADTHNNQWLEIVYDVPSAPMAMPACGYALNEGMGYAQTIYTGRINAGNEASRCGVYHDGEVASALVDDVNTAVSPPSAPPTKVPSGGRPDVSPCPDWQYILGTNEDDLREIYFKYVAGNVVGMDLGSFVNQFGICNRIDRIEEDAIILHADWTYYLPNGSHP